MSYERGIAMKSKTCVSTKPAAQAAVDELFSGISQPKGIIFLCDYSRLEEISGILHRKYPDVPTIGTAGKCYLNTTIADSSILVACIFLSDAVVSCGVMRYLSTDPMSDLNHLTASLNAISPGRDNTICIEFCTNHEEKLISTMNIALEKYGTPLAGGTVFGTPEGKTSLVTVNGKSYADACAYAVVKNTNGKAAVYKENIYGRGSDNMHVVTKVNIANKELIQLDGRPAADVYSAETGIGRSDIVGNVLTQPLGRVLGDDVYICSQYAIGSNGSLICYKQSNENDTINILKLLDYRDIVEDTKNEIKASSRSISTVISFNCIYRYMLFEQEGYTQDYLKTMSALGGYMGYIAGGEQYNHQHVNQTMVCAVFE